jgi:hypothetical protein
LAWTKNETEERAVHPSPSIVIRHAVEEDLRTLAGLAILDSRTELTGPALLAEVDGVARAALDLRDGSVAADPFAPTNELVELLRLRARRLAAAHGTRRSLRSRAKAIVRRPRTARC